MVIFNNIYALSVVFAWGYLLAWGWNTDTFALAVLFGWIVAPLWPVWGSAMFFHNFFF